MLETFHDIVNEVLEYGFNDGPQVNRGRIKNWVNEGQRQIARQVEAPEFQETEELVMVPKQFKYPLPAGFLRVQDIQYELMTTRLRPLDQKQFDLVAPAQTNGPPAVYTLYQQSLYLYPNPESADTLFLRYYKMPSAMVNDTDIPTLNVNYLHLLVDYALVRAYEAEDDIEMAQYWTGRYAKDLDAYASDVQDRIIDTPRQVTGTWGNSRAMQAF